MTITQTAAPANRGGSAGARPVSPPASDRDFRSLFEHSGLCMVVLDQALAIQEANDDFAREVGWASAVLWGSPLLHVVHPSTRTHLSGRLARLAEGKGRRVVERVVIARPGDEFAPALLSATTAAPDEYGARRILVVVRFDGSDDAELLSPGHRQVLSQLDAKILENVAAGVSSVQMASRLYLSRQGVEYHVSAMLRKLKAPNRAALVSRAYAMGVLAVGVWPPRVQPEYVK